MRLAGLMLTAALLALVLAPAGAEEAHTTRILTEPVYGATVTVEHGVNVYRPVPPTTHLIVNPGEASTVIFGSGTRHIITGSTSTVTTDDR